MSQPEALQPEQLIVVIRVMMQICTTRTIEISQNLLNCKVDLTRSEPSNVVMDAASQEKFMQAYCAANAVSMTLSALSFMLDLLQIAAPAPQKLREIYNTLSTEDQKQLIALCAAQGVDVSKYSEGLFTTQEAAPTKPIPQDWN